MSYAWLDALLGGALIGLAAAILLAGTGRVAGVSGVLGRLIAPHTAPDRGWRIAFLLGLAAPGAIAALVAPPAIVSVRPLALIAVAGVLVGVGTCMGNGCTSGHGVCGLARLSKRSLVAVLT